MLRVPGRQDFDAFADFCANAETMRFLGGAKLRSAAWRVFTTIVGAWTTEGYSYWSVLERESGRWVGRIGPWQPEGWPGTEIAWGIAPEFAGRGYAYEAAAAAMDYAVDVLRWTHLIHTIHPDNAPSIRLAQRLGSINEGPTALPDPLSDFRVDAWGQSADQWRARRATGR